MTDGPNEPVQFTRGDAERMSRLEGDMHHIKKMISRIMYLLYSVGVTTIFFLATKLVSFINGE